MNQVHVIAIGELLGDLISVDFVNHLGEADRFVFHAGGSPANVCANLQWLGCPSALVSCVGNDALGSRLIATVASTGVDVSAVSRSKEPTSIVLVGRSKGTPDFIAYRGADRQLPAIDPALISKVSLVHTCAFALSLAPARDNVLGALEAASRQGKTVSIDWNFAPQLWPDDGTSVFQQVMHYRPLLKISMDDIIRYEGRELSVEEAKSVLAGSDCSVVCLTCGRDGVWYRERGKAWFHAPAEQVAEVKDTTGAGDAFWAGFLSSYLRRNTVSDCVREGIALATRKIQHVGPVYLNA